MEFQTFQNKRVCPIMLIGNYGMIQVILLNLFPKGVGRRTIISQFIEKNGEQLNYKGEDILLRLDLEEDSINIFF